MPLDLSRVPVIDNHMHVFAPRKPEGRLGFAISAFQQEPRHLRSSMTYYMMMKELRRILDMADATEDEVYAERSRRLETEPRAYIQQLMADASLRMLVCDIDAPVAAYWTGKYRTDEELEEFLGAVEPEVEVASVIRIEVACNRLLDRQLPFADFCEAFRARMEEGLRRHDAVGVKSVIGYFTGLAVENPGREQAEKAYTRFLQDREDHGAEKIWRDYMLHRGLEFCAANNLPLQIHTGLGVTPYSDLRRMNPLLLYDFLIEETSRTVPTILVHAGYPYVRETAILASHLPQVYLDFSELVPYAGRAAENTLPLLMEVAPLTKIMFGTDGGGIVEPIWFGAVHAKRAVARVLEDCVTHGMLTEREAMGVAEDILYRNVLALYPKLQGRKYTR